VATTTLAVDRPAEAPETAGKPRDPRSRWFNGFCLSILIVFAAVWALPLVWALVTSLRPEAEISAHPTSWWTSHWNLDAYRAVVENSDLPKWYANSLITSVLSAFLTIVVCSLAGFALSRTRFRGRRAIFGLLLAGIIIPGQVLIIPLFQEMGGIHLLNTYWAMVLPAVPAPVAVFVFASFFAGIPEELAESGRMDGAGWLRIYARIFLPLSKPAISAVTIFTFVWSWNSLLWPLLTLTSSKIMTIPVGLSSVQSAYGIIYGQVMASAILGALPLVLVFLVFQRPIVEGIANTGLK
jgi:multiple sugar transport system permease protein